MMEFYICILNCIKHLFLIKPIPEVFYIRGVRNKEGECVRRSWKNRDNIIEYQLPRNFV